MSCLIDRSTVRIKTVIRVMTRRKAKSSWAEVRVSNQMPMTGVERVTSMAVYDE